MIRRIHLGLASLALAAGLVGCSALGSSGVSVAATTTETTTATTSATTDSGSDELAALLAENEQSHLVDGDTVYDESSVVDISLHGTSATASGDGVEISGSTVTITAGGVYRLSGSLTGQIVVAADAQEVKVILNGVDLHSDTGSPFVVTDAEKVTLLLAAGTTNSMADATTYAHTSDGAPSSTIDSSSDLTIAGSGTLRLTGNNNDAINSSDGLVIAEGTIEVTAVDDGIRGQDHVIISGGTVRVTATGDGVKADNETDTDRGFVWISGGELTVASGDDGITGFTDVAISGGKVTVTESVEGLEAQTIVIADGELSVTSSDDGMNISGDAPTGLTISGGTVVVDADGDGIDSNGSASISGGSVTVLGPTNDGNGTIDVDQGLVITGGELWALGSSGMAETPTQASTQGFVFTTLASGATGEVTIADSNGTVIASQESTKQYASILYSGPAIDPEGNYRITVGGTEVDTVAANQYQRGMQPPAGGGPGGERP